MEKGNSKRLPDFLKIIISLNTKKVHKKKKAGIVAAIPAVKHIKNSVLLSN
jgi:hypothetical protein